MTKWKLVPVGPTPEMIKAGADVDCIITGIDEIDAPSSANYLEASMSDKELLELAAKAAGYSVEWIERRVARIGAFKQMQHERRDGFVMAGKEWNPLTDDGDALRLAVRLNIDFKAYDTVVRTWVGDFTTQKVISSVEEICGVDPYAATRRAITRAAAEIGKAMP